MAAVTHQNGGAQALIARVRRSTNVAMAADGGHTGAGAGAKYGDLDAAPRHSICLLLGFVGHLHIAEPQQSERILQQPLFFEVRLPRVFSWNMAMRSMVWRARSRSAGGCSSGPRRIKPSCISACRRRDSARNSKDAGGRGNGPSFLPSANVGIDVGHLLFILQRSAEGSAAVTEPRPDRRGASGGYLSRDREGAVLLALWPVSNIANAAP